MTSTLENNKKTAEPLRDDDQPIGTLAGGEAASVAALLEDEAEELGTASHGPGATQHEPSTGNPPA